jgi:dTDP-glucose 4,6-dehydratase
MAILVTGGAGFIGSNFVVDWLEGSGEPIVNLDRLTYAGNLQNLASVSSDPASLTEHQAP